MRNLILGLSLSVAFIVGCQQRADDRSARGVVTPRTPPERAVRHRPGASRFVPLLVKGIGVWVPPQDSTLRAVQKQALVYRFVAGDAWLGQGVLVVVGRHEETLSRTAGPSVRKVLKQLAGAFLAASAKTPARSGTTVLKKTTRFRDGGVEACYWDRVHGNQESRMCRLYAIEAPKKLIALTVCGACQRV